MNVTNLTDFLDNTTITLSVLELANPCPRQRSIARPLLFVHNYALFFFGSIFNFLAFAILIQRSLRCQSTFAYLAFLSLSNGLLSLVHFSKWMFNYYFHLLFENFLITCRFHRFSSDFLTHFSLFTLICVNIDRARTVTKNHPNTKYGKSKFRMIVIKECFVAGILCAFHFHWIIKYGYHVWDEGVKQTACSFDENQPGSIYNYFLKTIYPPFELLVFFCLPLLINIFCTIIIIRSLSIRMRTAQQFRPSKISLKDKSLDNSPTRIFSYFLPKTNHKSNIHSCLCFQIQCRRHTRIRLKISGNKQSLIKYAEENETIEKQRSSTSPASFSHDNSTQMIQRKTSNILHKQHRTRRSRDIHLSAMLIALNILYLLLNLPFNLHQTFFKHFHDSNSNACNIMFVSVLLDALQQTFFSTNFFLYVLTNRRFREEFYNTIIPILAHCKFNSLKKNVNQDNSKYRTRSSSYNPSTSIIHLNSNGDNLNITKSILPNRDSVRSDIELTDAVPIQHQTSVSINKENNKFISKLVMFKGLSNY